MLEVLLKPRKGNVASGLFPFTGILGLQNVTVQGQLVVRPKHEEASLPTSRISVRIKCSQFRKLSLMGREHEVTLWDHWVTLWDASTAATRKDGTGGDCARRAELGAEEDTSYQDISMIELPFAIGIPSDVANRTGSAMTLPDYRIVWRVQGVLEHKPISLVGRRIVRSYLLPIKILKPLLEADRPLSPPSEMSTEGPDLRVDCVWSGIPDIVGPGEEMPLALAIRATSTKDDESVVVDKVTVALERKVWLSPLKASRASTSASSSRSATRETSLDPYSQRRPAISAVHLVETQSSSSTTPSRRSSSDPPSGDVSESEVLLEDETSLPSIMVNSEDSISTNSTGGASSSWARGDSRHQQLGMAVCSRPTESSDGSGTTWARLPMQMPINDHRWEIGESLTTAEAEVRFELIVKIQLSRRSITSTSSRSTSTSLELSPVPLTVVAFSRDDRRRLIDESTASTWYPTASTSASSSSSTAALLVPKKSSSGLYALANSTLDFSDSVSLASSSRIDKMSIATLSSSLLSIPHLDSKLRQAGATPSRSSPSTPMDTPPASVPSFLRSPPPSNSFSATSTSQRRGGRDRDHPKRPSTADATMCASKEKSPSRRLIPGNWFSSMSPSPATPPPFGSTRSASGRNGRPGSADGHLFSFKRRPSATGSEEEMALPARSRQRISDLLA